MNKICKIAVLAAPPLGHISRVTRLLKHLTSHLNFDATVFIPRMPHFPQYEIKDHNVIDIPVNAKDWLTQGQIYAKALEAYNLHQNYDVVLYDTNPLQWLYAVDLPPLKTACLTNIFLTRPAGETTIQIDRHKADEARYNDIRKIFGRPALSSPYDLYEADLVLLADPLPIIESYGPLPSHYQSFGGAFWSASGAIPEELRGIDDILLISLGSTGSKRLLTPALIDALKANTGSKYVVMTGTGALPDYADFIFERLPIDDILPQCRAVVSQGGSGASYQALAQKTPVIIAPNHKNHVILGQRLDKLGLGVLIKDPRPETLPSRAAFQAVQRQINNMPMNIGPQDAYDAMAKTFSRFCQS